MDDRPVLVLYAGGTIGMRPTAEGWAPGADLAGWLESLLAQHFAGLRHELVALEPLVDSSNSSPVQWQRIIDAVLARRSSHRGFVVLHGTDTLAFSAAAAQVALAGSGLGVVFTGAQRSLVLADSDAPANVVGALRCALDERLREVALYFDSHLLHGAHATKTSSVADHGFDSPNLAPLAVLGPDGAMAFRDSARPAAPDRNWTAPAPYREVDLAVVSLHPGLQPRRLAAQLTPAPDAVVVRAYGAGNAPDDPAILDALRAAHDAGSVLVATTQCLHGGAHLGEYAASQTLLRAGALGGGALPVEAIVARLSFLLSQGIGPDQVRSAWPGPGLSPA